MAVQTFDFSQVANGSNAQTAQITIGETGEVVRVRFEARKAVSAKLEVVANGVTTREPIEDDRHFVSGGFLVGDLVRVTLSFLSEVGVAKGVLESGA